MRARLTATVAATALMGAVVAVGVDAPSLAAQAAGVTAEQVTRIANRVVTDRAGGLTVAAAHSADDATLLAGRSPASYRTQAIDFRLPVDNDRKTFRSYALSGVPNGSYLVSYDITFMPVSPGNATAVSCALYQNAPPDPQPAATGISSGLTATGSAVLTFRTGSPAPSLACHSDGDGFTIIDHRITNYHVTGVRVDATAEGTVTESSSD